MNQICSAKLMEKAKKKKYLIKDIDTEENKHITSQKFIQFKKAIK